MINMLEIYETGTCFILETLQNTASILPFSEWTFFLNYDVFMCANITMNHEVDNKKVN